AKMSSYNPESAYIRTYLETLIEMPWQAKSTKAINIHDSEKILEEDHYGLPKAKERILEYLAVNKLVGKIRGPILCFYGPPGVGKTSIGKSIAKSLGREFVRMSLGGVHDEAEIRGHRRTYVGAMPGRIIQGIKNSGSTNPVFMLDEIDKVTSNYRGDPSAALLEALDPEQNNSFSDHYLEVPYDLSDVMFIATANQLNTIPDALLDRMEVIDFPGYTEEEKFNIAKNFLLPKQLKNHGLKSDKIIFEDSSLREIISKYTREAGVRNLEREIGTVCRKIAKAVATNEIKSIKVSSKNLEKFLGIEKFKHTLADSHDDIGIATGLSVTNVGGEILFIEVSVIPGKGQLMLTGQLGDVMKESAHAAMSYIRSRWKKLGLKKNFNQEVDIHIHVPEGGIPKEGPSAGTAIATALISALTKKKSISSVGMTGEITLRGRVLPIGGVKEKVLAAHRAGLKTVILPLDNKKDTEEIAQNIKKDLTLVFVKHLDEVLRVAFKSSKKGGGSGSLNKKSPVKRKHPITTIGA
ncbi:MAG: endopeptidase La, partial [Saprospiraceae bacterium]|nr:endopeptidase La [Saprospiraceae bacterium]